MSGLEIMGLMLVCFIVGAMFASASVLQKVILAWQYMVGVVGYFPRKNQQLRADNIHLSAELVNAQRDTIRLAEQVDGLLMTLRQRRCRTQQTQKKNATFPKLPKRTQRT